MLYEWVNALKEDLATNAPNGPWVAALATVDELGRPHARSVVCRRVGEDGSIFFFSDARSQKNQQLRHRPDAEAVFWISGRRTQYRLTGRVEIQSDPDSAERAAFWFQLSDASRALFFWPEPGKPLEADASFPAAIPETSAAPPTFEVLILRTHQVERLEISPQPHRRTRWRADRAWTREPLNP